MYQSVYVVVMECGMNMNKVGGGVGSVSVCVVSSAE